MFTTTELETLITVGDHPTAQALVSLLPPAVASRSRAADYVSSDVPYRRFCGVTRVVVELAYAVDPEKATGLWEPFRALPSEAFFARIGVGSLLGAQIVRSGFAAAAHATLQCGHFDAAIELCDEADHRRVANQPDEIDAWIENVRLEALIRTFRIEQAFELRARRARRPRSPTDRQDELDEMLDTFIPDHPASVLLEPAGTFSWIERTRDMLAAWVDAQAQADTQLHASYAALRLTEAERTAIDGHFAAAAAARQAVASAITGDHAQSERDDVIHRALFQHQTAVRALQEPAAGRRPTLHDNRHRLNHAAMTFGLAAPTADEMAEADANARSAAAWSASGGDRYGELMASWTIGLVADRRGRADEAFAAFARTFAVFEAMRPQLPTGAARSLLSGTFRTLIPRLAAHAHALGDDALAFRALEFRRGLAIVEADRGGRPGTALPSGIHYLSASILEEEGVLLVLRTADGVLSIDRLEGRPERLHALASRVDPAEWIDPFTRRDRSPRAELGALMQPLERALKTGRIARGDHVAMALDHPLHTVPIHYLDLDGELAVRRLTFSRVASWDDLIRIAAKPVVRPAQAAGIFVMPTDAVDIAPHEREFEESITPLLGVFDDVLVLEGEEATRPRVLSCLASHDLTHVYTHGTFPPARPGAPVDPMRDAGLLVATQNGLPSRSDPQTGLLRGLDILEGPAVAARHVSLSACVSGLGRPGQGQDMLGLEFALRARGVESVLASHWHVEGAVAARFFRTFYEVWLGEGLARAEAWRRAILAHADPDNLPASCAACAFSLYGDWR